MTISSVSSRSPYDYNARETSFPERVLEKAKDLVPERVRTVAWAVTMPIYLTVAFGGIGAVLGGTVGGLGGPLGLIAGGLSGAAMGGSAGAVLGSQLGLAALASKD